MKYFISDLHFGHKNILTFERTEFATIEEHDQYIIDTINNVVTNTDELYILGDIGSRDKIRYLNGRKILVMGNHDEKSAESYRAFFSEVYDTPIYLSKRILLSHIPHPVDDGVLNVHGHLHGTVIDKPNYINISAKHVNYKPLTLKYLEARVSGLPKVETKFLYEWYADLYKFKPEDERIDVVFNENGNILLEESRILHKKLKTDRDNYVLNVFKEKDDGK